MRLPTGVQSRLIMLCVGALPLFCAGCQSLGAFTGATSAAVTGAVTANPAGAIGTGIAVQAATDEVVKRTMRGLHQDQQDAIATAAGFAPIGAVRVWKVDHMLPVGNGYGRVRVLRDFSTPLTSCREFAFSVIEDNAPRREQWFMASACKQGGWWKWALAEPSTGRWGNLQ